MQPEILIVPVNDELHLETQEGQVVVSSRYVAERFGKEHKNVLRDIESIIKIKGGMLKIEPTPKNEMSEKSTDLFITSQYQHPQNKQWYPEYLLTRDGFTLLAMGFTGQEALKWKLKYIEAFNKMEQALREQVSRLEYDQELQELGKVAKAIGLSKKDKVIATISILQKHQMPTLGLEQLIVGEGIKTNHYNPEMRKQAVDYIKSVTPEGCAVTEYYQIYSIHCVREGITNIGRISFSKLIKELGYESKAKRINGEVCKAWSKVGTN